MATEIPDSAGGAISFEGIVLNTASSSGSESIYRQYSSLSITIASGSP